MKFHEKKLREQDIISEQGGKLDQMISKKVDVGLFKKQTVRHFFQIVFSLDFILMCQSMGINLENLPQIHCFEEY